MARRTSFPKAAEILLAAEDDVLAYPACPREHWTKIWSTNPLERVKQRSRRLLLRPDRQRLAACSVAALAVLGFWTLVLAALWWLCRRVWP